LSCGGGIGRVVDDKVMTKFCQGQRDPAANSARPAGDQSNWIHAPKLGLSRRKENDFVYPTRDRLVFAPTPQIVK
jgi:hypothetical protein